VRTLLLIAALGAGGCNLVFGLDQPDDDGAVDGGVDAPRGFDDPVTLLLAGTVDLAILPPSGGRTGQALVLAVDSSAVVMVTADAVRDVSATFLSLDAVPVSLAALDFNLDGLGDVAVVTVAEVSLIAGKLDGSLAYTTSLADMGGSVYAAGRFTAPAGVDLVVAHAAVTTVSEWLSDGAGGHVIATLFATDGEPAAIESIELDGTAGDELVVSDSVGVRTYRRSAVALEPLGSALSGPATALLATRLDEDVALDVLIGGADGRIAVWQGDGEGSFRLGLTLPTEAVGAMALARGDGDGDGHDDDLAVAAPAAGVVQIFRSQGGELAELHRFPFAEAPTDVAFADLDGDGLDDLVVVLASAVMIFFGR
jgi:hypothetical protein